MLVAIADVALLLAAAGLFAVVAGAVILAAGIAGVWTLQRRTTPQRESVVVRRRA